MHGITRAAISTLGALCLLIVSSPKPAGASGPAGNAFPVRIRTAPGTHYVGQAIDLAVSVVAGGERPKIVMPRVENADVSEAGTDFKPISTSAIGDLVDERNLYVFRYRVVPRRAGTLNVPPVVARTGERSGSSARVRVAVQDLPAAGRPTEFLGGVGAFTLKAEASPALVRAGQELEYRITVTGPAARGMFETPSVDRFSRLPLGLRMTPLPPESVAEPPSRVFRFRLRPTRAGDATLPPVAIAAFEPKSGRYVTKVTPGVPIRVVDVPRFDPSSLSYRSPLSLSGREQTRLLAWVGGLSAVALAGSAGTLLGVRWARARRGRDWRARRLAARLARELNAAEGAARSGRRVTEGLAAYLRIASGRPPGALTPPEAEDGMALATGSIRLGVSSGQLIALCDRAQYAGNELPAEQIVDEARRLWIELERWDRGRENGEGSGIVDPENTERGSRGRPDVNGGGQTLPL